MTRTYPLLQSQMSVAIEWIAHPETTKYNLPVHLVFSKKFDAERIGKAVLRVVKARNLLRLRLVQDERGEIRQFIDDNLDIPVETHYMTDADAEQYVKRDFLRPFTPFSAEPLVRFEVIVADSHNHLLADFHHIIADGTTLAPLWSINDLKAALNDEQLQPDDYSILQYAEEEQLSFLSEGYARAKAYYAEKFSGVSFTDISEIGKSPFGNQIICSEQIDAAQVEEWGRANGVTSNLLFMAAYAVVLSRFSGEEKVAFCTLNHGRTDRRVRSIYGMFVKNAPVMADVSPSKNVLDFVKEQRRELMSAVRYAAYPITHFCRDLNIPLCTVFAFQGAEMHEYIDFDDERVKATQLPHGLTDEELACMVYTSGGDYEIRLMASDGLYSESRLGSFAKAVLVCVRNIMQNPQQTIGELQIVDEDERAELLKLGSTAATEIDDDDSFINLFLNQVGKTPDAIAVVDETGSYTYAELERESARYAELYSENTFICLPTHRNKDFLARAIGIERAGCAYVPVDVDLPIERQQFIIDEADGKPCPEGTAYMIYTSGTSGRPKGVIISHRAKANLIRFIAQEWHLNEKSRISCHSSFAFDASVEDLFPVLTVGGTVYIVPEKVRMDLPLLYNYICENGITGGCYTTQFGQLLLQHYPDLPVEYLVVGGEKMTQNPDCRTRLINTYGPTEFTVDATFCELEHGKYYENIPIGRPLPNTSAFILDRKGNLLPRGVAGELCLSGIQMSDGYWNQPELTSEKFNEYYRTGDLCRWNSDGQLEYICRLDRQVKLRGYRIELAEIERVAMLCEEVMQAVAVLKNIDGTERIVLYVQMSGEALGRTDETTIKAEINRRMRASLPSYMCPDILAVLDEIPMTSNGKTDLGSLPQPAVFSSKEGALPVTETERKLCTIFAAVLGRDTYYADDDFWFCGGTSLLAIRVVMEAANSGLKFTYQEFFDHPTPQLLAAFIDGNGTPQKKHNIADYDYAAIDRLLTSSACLLNNHELQNEDVQSDKAPLGNVLLLGANGFLGIHLLYDLLHDYESKIICAVRAENDAAAYSRLKETFEHYHSELLDNYADRLCVVAFDITDKSSFHKLALLHIDTAINCAANVRHFAKTGEIEAVNYYGLLNILDFCKQQGIMLVHASTTSVCGSVGNTEGSTSAKSPVLSEKSLFIGQDCNANDYVCSKFLAERTVLQAVADGYRAKVIRLGNLSPRMSDGRFQTNADDSTFLRTFKGFARAAAYPKDIAEVPMHLEPIDETARAFLLLAQTPDSCPLLHCCNNHVATYGNLISAMQQSGIAIDALSIADFYTRVESLDAEDKTLMMTNIVAYGINAGQFASTPRISSEFSNELLAAMNFKWAETGCDYMLKFVEELKMCGFFL